MNKSPTAYDYFKHTLYFTLLLWSIKYIEDVWSLDLRFLAISPREVTGLFGILFSPVLHGSWGHLAANSLPLLGLGALLAFGYPVSKWKTWAIVWLVSGVGVWLFGRSNYHLGASGLTTGLFYFLLLVSILRRDKVSIALMFIAVFMFGSLFLGVLPWDPKISFEAHFFGAVGGCISAVLFRNQDPKPKPKIYDWERPGYSLDEEEDAYWKSDFLQEDSDETERPDDRLH